jgi:hypothetical protein
MKSDEFHARYQILKQVTDGSVRTFHAVARTGAVVMVHYLTGGVTGENYEILALIERLPPDDRARVLPVAEVDDEPVVVTRFVLDFRTLRDWLESRATPATDAPPTAPSPPAAEAAPSI